MTEDQKRYMNAVSEMQRIKGRIILLLIAAAVFAVLNVLVLILRPGTNILPLTVTWFGFALVMALVETTTLNSQSKIVEQLEEEMNTEKAKTVEK